MSGRAFAAALCFIGFAAAPAAADPMLVRGISDSLSLNAAINARAPGPLLGQMADAGAGIVRVGAGWRASTTDASGLSREPIDARDPADPAYDFSLVDSTVRAVAAAGLQPLIVVSHAPDYAEAQPRWKYAQDGSWGVRPSALAAFGAALASRFSGTYVPAGAELPLPRVAFFQAWNEPNLPNYLGPQWIATNGHWRPWAAVHYRLMQNAFYDAVKAVDPAATVVSAGIAPNGDPADGGQRTSPVRFIRAFLCLDVNGAPARPRCADPPRLDAFAFHPLSVGDPDRPARFAADIAVADIGKLTHALRTAVAAHLLARLPPLWVTELNWTTGARGAPRAVQARWVGRGLHRLWLAGARVVLWQFLQDRADQRPAGLLTSGGRRKLLWTGWTFPLDALRETRQSAQVWLMAPPGVTRVCLDLRRRGVWRRGRCVAVARDRPRTLHVALGGATALRGRAGAVLSAVTAVGE